MLNERRDSVFVHSGVVHLADDRVADLSRAYATATAARRRSTLLAVALTIAATALSAWVADVDLRRLLANIGSLTDYFDRILTLDNGPSSGQRVWTDPAEWFWGWSKWLWLLLDTLLIAYLGTILGFIAGAILCFFAASNMMPDGRVRWVAKRFLEFCRTVPDIVFALIFVIAFGLGPIPGVLALAIHSAGALGKLYTEIVENADLKPFEGVTAAGASWVQAIRFAIVPQVLSNFASYAMLRFEVNVRGASVMGFVGAGGIGQDLIEAIRKFYYADVSAIIVLLIATVVLIDLATERLRHSLVDVQDRR